ncbi:MAG: AAA family ATPase [Candidatus Woesearchaeota archaeon]|nr:AAA family ATPase [Candidatus Woesearchaeota archaeon]
MERIKFFIDSIDGALDGGIPKKNTVLLAGSAGTGKTTLAMQFLFNGAKKNEKSLFLTMYEPEIRLKEYFEEFSFYDQNLVVSGDMALVDLRPIFMKNKKNFNFIKVNEVLDYIALQLQKYKPKRVVIDSITSVCNYFKDDSMIREFIFSLCNLLFLFDCTTLLVSEVGPTERRYSNFNIEEFIADGIIYLQNYERKNRLVKTLQIVKMRGTEHKEDVFALNISKKGITLFGVMDK